MITLALKVKLVAFMAIYFLAINSYCVPIMPHIADNGYEGEISGNWQIEDRELLYAINQWSYEVLTDDVLLSVINFWSSNGYFFDTETKTYKAIGGNDEKI